MASIKIDFSSLEKNASDMNSYITQLQTLNTQLDSLIVQVSESWEGTACEAYIAKMQERSRKAKEMIEVLTAFRTYMTQTVQQFRSEDQNNASRIRNS